MIITMVNAMLINMSIATTTMVVMVVTMAMSMI